MTIPEAVNRTTNLLGTAVVALAGFAFLPEAFVEDEHTHKIDDGLLFLLGLAAIVWYRKGNNRGVRSVMPVLFPIAALLIKLLGLWIEFGDKEDIGDEFGAVILFILATLLVWSIYKKRQGESAALAASSAEKVS